eukprot:scaffold299468_cov28-Tisochrysis_lutea.AAC.1
MGAVSVNTRRWIGNGIVSFCRAADRSSSGKAAIAASRSLMRRERWPFTLFSCEANVSGNSEHVRGLGAQEA